MSVSGPLDGGSFHPDTCHHFAWPRQHPHSQHCGQIKCHRLRGCSIPLPWRKDLPWDRQCIWSSRILCPPLAAYWLPPILKFSLIIHRKFGYVSVAVFISHMLASINNLIFNEAEHHWLNRAGLGSLTIVSTAYMILSIKAVKQGDIPGHTDYAIRSFLYSIEGAGTIRQVAYLQWLASPYVPSLLAGPGPCQLVHLGKATHCVPAYFIRGIFTRLLTLYYICVYELSKKKFNIKKVLCNENVMAVCCTLVFLCVDTTVTKFAY